VAIKIRVAAVLVESDAVLLAMHRRRGETTWALPGGGLEEGEALEECLVREMREETGIPIRVGRLMLVADVVPPAGSLREQTLNLVFHVTRDGQAHTEARSVRLDEAHDAVRFVPLDDLEQVGLRPPIGEALRAAIAEGPNGPARYLGNVWAEPARRATE